MGGLLRQHWKVWQEAGVEQWTVDVLSFSCRLAFHHQPPMTSEPIEFPSYGLGFPKIQVLQAGVDTVLLKDAMEIISKRSQCSTAFSFWWRRGLVGGDPSSTCPP